MSLRALTIGMALLAAACKAPDDGILTASGTTEVVQTDVAPLTAARITFLAVNEGDSVHAGDTLVRLTLSTLASDLEMSQARVSAAMAALRDLEAGARPAEIDRAEAELRVAQTDLDRATSELRRATSLLQSQAISQAQFDAAKTAADAASARRDVLAQAMTLMKAGARPERIEAARAEVAAARAALNASRARSQDLVLTAPVAGVILAKYVEAGEVIAAGIPAFTIGDLQQPWVRVFVAAPALPKLHVGMEAFASVQGLNNDLFAARIISIDASAQFTPRIALTESERADLMFGVKVQLATGTKLLKPGLPIDLHFDTLGTGFPASFTAGKRFHPIAVPNGGG